MTASVLATVEVVEHLGRTYAGPALWEFNAGFAVVVTIDSFDGDRETTPDFVTPGARIAFAVHSPTYVFAFVGTANEAIGQRYHFTLERVGGTKWWRIVAAKA